MEENPLLAMLKPWTLAAIALGPFLFQYVKALILKFKTDGAELSKKWATILNTFTIVGVIIWQGNVAGADITTIAAQCAIGVIVSEVIYKQAVERMANSNNPIVPQTATKKEAAEERSS